MKIRVQQQKPARIEMLPLIDVVFLLLVVFIYAMLSMAVHRGLRLDLPVSERAAAAENSLSLTVIQPAANPSAPLLYSLNGDPVSLDQLEQQLRRFGNDPVSPPILLFAGKGISYQQLYAVLDLLKKNGCTAVSLQAAVPR